MTKRAFSKMAILIAVIILIIGGGALLRPAAFARADSYTNVLTDLSTDKDFNASDYPERAGDYSLEVVQIAEGAKGELFVYVYQPSVATKQLTATCINMSLSEEPEGTKLYGLAPISRSGVFTKYAVNDFTVSASEVRYYNITSIYRAFDKTIDKGTGNDNTINEIAYPVAQVWMASTVDGTVEYKSTVTDVVEIRPEQKYVGFLRYQSGFIPFLWNEKCDSHYVAFDCNYSIDELYEADVSFVVQKRELREGILVHDIPIGNPDPNQVTLKGNQKGGNKATGLFADCFEWERIERVSDFISDPNNMLSDEAKEKIKNKQWVLRFTETEYLRYTEMNVTVTDYSAVSEVTILRLDFKSAGKVYNLGVVDNKQGGGSKPSNPSIPPWNGAQGIGILPLIVAISIIASSVVLFVVCYVINKKVGKRTMTIIGSFLAAVITAVLRVTAGVYADSYVWVSSCILPLNIICGLVAGVFVLFVVIEAVHSIRGRNHSNSIGPRKR